MNFNPRPLSEADKIKHKAWVVVFKHKREDSLRYAPYEDKEVAIEAARILRKYPDTYTFETILEANEITEGV